MTLYAGTTTSLRHLLMLILVVVLFLVLLPVIIPLVAVMHWRHEARMRKLAAEMTCVRCEQVMGATATKLADSAWSAEFDAIMKQSPGIRRRRIVRTVDAICPHCALRYRYIDELGRFVH
jgi:hypothetical protein